ncbi:AAA-like domain-containing protein, partial [Scytonema sp. PCC 10023]|uniref:WD40 domain-containing protein n=1 Tax=Scytonema sp. PCC 10023 TaxID=1680591 RepID=UPI0039C62585
MDTQIPYEYVYSATLDINSPTYTKRKADTELYEALKAGRFCYVFNSRKTGKSSLRVQIMRRLQNDDNIACAAIDLSMGGTNYATPEQWYADIIDTLVDIFNLDIDLDSWWSKLELLSPVKRFSKFIETILLVQVAENNNQKIVIFIDEIDSILSLKFGSDDFFALIRACYNQRADKPIYNHLTFCLLGVATPSDLIADKTRTPFNIGQAIELTGFTLAEAKPTLIPPLAGKVEQPEIVLQEVLNWTGGQPFLTQKVCNLLVQSSSEPQENGEAQWVEEIVKNRIITNWESQDEPEILRTILNRIISKKNEKYRSRLLGLYQRILLSTTTGASDRQLKVIVDESTEQVELRLSGLVVKSNNILQVYNRIYESVFNWNWVEKELAKLRPYAQSLQAWFDSNCQDESRLLRGQALLDANAWAMGKSLGDRDNEFLRASDALEKQQAEIEKRQAEIALEQERKARELDSLEYQVNLEAERKSAEAERKSAEAQMQANNTLKKANKKANRRVRIGGIILVISLVLLLLSLFGARQAELSRQNALTATRLEQEATNALRDFNSGREIDGLRSAMQTGRELKSLIEQKQSLADYPAYSPVFSLQTILRDIREKNRLEGHTAKVLSVAFSPDGKTLAFTSDDNTIKLWNISTLKQISTLSGHTREVFSVAFSPNGKILASASLDNTIKLWNISTLKQIYTFTGHTAEVESVAFSPDGKTLASASLDNTIKLWNISTLKQIYTFTGHTAEVESVAFSPDGKTLASGSGDNSIKLWNISTLKQIYTFTRYTGAVKSVAFSPDGKTLLASASEDNTIKLWNISTGK